MPPRRVRREAYRLVRRHTLFLDDGGVVSNNAARAPQWQRLVAEFFVPRLGGTPPAWAKANLVVASRLFGEAGRELMRASSGVADHTHRYRLAWLGGMCAEVGVAVPPEERCLEWAEEATRYVTRRVRAAYPGVPRTVRQLGAGGRALHTASGESSRELAGYLEAMGVRDCFGILFGPDLIDCWKDGPEYYRHIFSGSGVDPGDAVVVDDSARCVAWAAEAGAVAVLIAPTGAPAGPGAPAVLPALRDLPRVLAQLEN